MTTATVVVKKPDGTQIGAVPYYDSSTSTMTIAPSAPMDTSKTYTVTLTTGLTAADGTPLSVAYTWSFTTTATAPPIRVNAGGQAYGSFMADQYFKGGTALTSANTIWGTSDPALFQAQRVGTSASPTVIYTLPVSNGTYDVKLYFAELQKTGPGQRVFNVDVSGTTPNPDISNLDVYAQAGGANRSLVKTISGAVACGSAIRITETAVTDYPAIAAIEIVPSGPNVC